MFVLCGLTTLIHCTHAVAQTSWSLPAPWSAQDIGAPSIPGSASFDQGRLTITAGGIDIWGQSDQFTFVYQQVTGDVDVIARVDSVTVAHEWSKAGLMVRSSLAADAAHALALVSAGRGVAFQRRLLAGGSSSNTYGPIVTPPRWVRAVRIGTTVTTYSSADGIGWTTVGSADIGLGAVAYVGLAVTSHNPSAATTAEFSQISMVPLALPSPQQAMDIGAPAVQGSVGYRQGAYSVRAGGADIWDTSDQFHFVYQAMTGDLDVVVRMNSITYAHRWAKTGVMIRETLTPGSRHGFAFLSAGQGYAFQRRVDTDAFSLHTAGTAGPTPGWVRLLRTGSRIEAFQSADGTTWTSIGSDIIPMADTVYVGIATTSHNTTAATSAVLDNLSIASIGGPQNQPPQVALTAPADGATVTAGSDVPVSAAANDADGTISRVDFFSGTTLIGSNATQPYAVTWQAVPAGTYTLTAVAFDNDGAQTTSVPVSVRVDTAANQPPTATLTAPANGAT